MAKVAPLDALAVISRPSALYFPDTLSEDPDDADSFVIKGDFTTMVTFSAQLPRFFVLRHERVLSETVVSISSITSSGADTVTDAVSHCTYVTLSPDEELSPVMSGRVVVRVMIGPVELQS